MHPTAGKLCLWRIHKGLLHLSIGRALRRVGVFAAASQNHAQDAAAIDVRL